MFGTRGKAKDKAKRGKGSAEPRYVVERNCSGCGFCVTVCPKGCLISGVRFVIDQKYCIRCGKCARECPMGAIKLHVA